MKFLADKELLSLIKDLSTTEMGYTNPFGITSNQDNELSLLRNKYLELSNKYTMLCDEYNKSIKGQTEVLKKCIQYQNDIIELQDKYSKLQDEYIKLLPYAINNDSDNENIDKIKI